MRTLVALLLLIGPVLADDGLVFHESLDKPTGKNVELRRGAFGSAGYFNGTDAFIEAAIHPGNTGAISIWCNPETPQGGLINWSTGSRWIDERLVLAINTYGSSQQLLHVYSDGLTSHASLGFKSVPQAGVWTHLAVTFDHHTITLYRDGVAVGGGPRGVNTVTEGVPMWIGRCLGLGMPYFHGLLDEARVYDRALSEVEVLGLFKRDAGGRGKDTRWFTQPKIDATIIAGAGKVYLKIDARAMRPLPPNARVVVKAGELSKTIELTDDGVAKWFVDFQAQAPGNYTVTAQVAGRGKTTRVKVNWPGQPAAFAHIKVLNNLVWEMLDEKNVGEGEYLIELPCDRWVFVQSDATTPPGGRRQIHIDDQRVIDHGAEGRQTLETMRFLRAGDHAVRITATGDGDIHQLIVRAIPMLQHANYNSNPIIKPHGPFDWDFVTRYLMRDVNTMVSRSGGVDESHLKQWTDSGRHWINMVTIPRSPGPLTADDAGVQRAFEQWTNVDAMQRPDMHGIIIDEFGGGDAPIYDTYRQAFECIYADPRFKGRPIMPYGGAFYGKNRSREMARVAIEGGGYVAWEVYLQEQPSEAAAYEFIRQRATSGMELWIDAMPTGARGMLMVWGIMSTPNESLNIHPHVDFKVYMDMQMQVAATEPAFFGLGGFQWYYSPYTDEESLRWMAKLYRHYCIEGNTDRLSKYPYNLPHVTNPDFVDGTTGWTLNAAEKDSITTGMHPHISWFEGRYPRTAAGSTFLLTRRSAAKPNTFSQTIKALEPGRLYSMKMFSADYQHLNDEVSDAQQLAVRISIDGVEMQNEPRDRFDYVAASCYSHIAGNFNAKHPYYMNYHWRVFRAKSETATLTVSDWADEKTPGGPVGQELIFNFIEVQPYLPR